MVGVWVFVYGRGGENGRVGYVFWPAVPSRERVLRFLLLYENVTKSNCDASQIIFYGFMDVFMYQMTASFGCRQRYFPLK
jgi:hypothetical protein